MGSLNIAICLLGLSRDIVSGIADEIAAVSDMSNIVSGGTLPSSGSQGAQMHCSAVCRDLMHQRVVNVGTSSMNREYSGGRGLGCRKLPVLNKGTAGVFPAGENISFGVYLHTS